MRSTTNIPIDMSPEETMSHIADFLIAAGYINKEKGGESVWQKGMGALTAPRFLKFDFDMPGYVTAESWTPSFTLLPGVYIGESPASSGMAYAIKVQLRNELKSIMEIIAADGREPEGYIPV